MRRVLVAAIGAPLLIYLAVHGSWPLVALVILLQAVILWEWHRLCQARGTRIFVPGLLLAACTLDFAVFQSGEGGSLPLLISGVGILLLAEMFRTDRRPLANLGGSVLFLLYIALPLALWALMETLPRAVVYHPAGPLTALLLATWMCDTGAYFVGRAIGKHKLYPAASPNKTVEGFIGGVLFSAIVLPVMAALGWAAPHLMDYVVLPLVVAGIGQCGDLLESLMKREAQVKDTSAILPGHGGFLDRFDSLLLSTPFFFAYLLLVID